jgi:hypothetical protein
MMPDAATDPVRTYSHDSWRHELVFVDNLVDVDAMFRIFGLSRAVADSLLRDEKCTFSGNSICDETPIQGVLADREGIWNKHHAEGNQHGGPLIPLLSDETLTEQNWPRFYISAYN